ncbi:hypothetical protein [Enterobacter hormaechei]|uniref:hypothetical protein n=1 Tax=Enterobacter hormaechei TaxID=158836 RepID=UPI000628432E|nr:hypothetical protein [Enterobacter hormaechei]KKO88591.1 hypothetical protein TN43_25500 [Enterobacter hormaechei]
MKDHITHPQGRKSYIWRFLALSAIGRNVIHITAKEGANKQVISSQADSLIKISRIWADFFPANTSNQPI